MNRNAQWHRNRRNAQRYAAKFRRVGRVTQAVIYNVLCVMAGEEYPPDVRDRQIRARLIAQGVVHPVS